MFIECLFKSVSVGFGFIKSRIESRFILPANANVIRTLTSKIRNEKFAAVDCALLLQNKNGPVTSKFHIAFAFSRRKF